MFLTIEQQIDLIKSKNIIIDKKTSLFLKKINYYHFMSYKNFFYQNGELHKYKTNITTNDFYTLYCYDTQIKKVLFEVYNQIYSKMINSLVNIIYNTVGFKDSEYLTSTIFKDKNKCIKLFETMIQCNHMLKAYKKEHGFIPIWIFLNSITINDFVDVLINLNNNIKEKLFNVLKISLLDNDFLYYLKNLYTNILTNNKTLDFKFNKHSIMNFIDFCEMLKINIAKIKKVYNDILISISSISYEDLNRETGYEDKYYDKKQN